MSFLRFTKAVANICTIINNYLSTLSCIFEIIDKDWFNIQLSLHAVVA